MVEEIDHLPTITPVVVGLTQEPTMLGVPYMALVLVGVVTFVAWLASASFWALLIGPACYFVMFSACSVDMKIMEVLRISTSKTPRTRNKVFWGATSYGP